MRKWIPFIACLLAVPVMAQVSNPSIIVVTTAPSGACASGLPNRQVKTTGIQYSCQNGTWAILPGQGSLSLTTTGTSGAASLIGTVLNIPQYQAALGFTPAHSGANSDITSLTGLTTPLSTAQGGTGAEVAGLRYGNTASADSAATAAQVVAVISTTAVANATAAATATNLAGIGVDYAPYQSASATTGYIAAPTASGHTFVYAWQPSGSAVAPTAVDLYSVPAGSSFNWTIQAGTTTSTVEPILYAAHAGAITGCYVGITATDPSTAFAFDIQRSGSSILSGGAQTIAATTTGYVAYALTAASLSVAQYDAFVPSFTTIGASWFAQIVCH